MSPQREALAFRAKVDKKLVPPGGINGRPEDLDRALDNMGAYEDGPYGCETCRDTGVLEITATEPEHPLREAVTEERPCPSCMVKRHYLDRDGERAMRVQPKGASPTEIGLHDCCECGRPCELVMEERYENGRIDYTCHRCDVRGRVQDLLRSSEAPMDPKLAERLVRHMDSYYEAVGDVVEVRKVWR